MIEKCADVVTEWLIGCGVIEKADRELYSYAVTSFLMSLSPLMMAVGFGIAMGCVRQSVMIVIPFAIIRKFSGGYHTKHLWTCLIGSCLLLFMCIVVSFHVRCQWICAFITVWAAVSLVIFSPIDNENRVLSQEEHRIYKKITAILVVSFLLVDVLFVWLHLTRYAVCISIGIILSAGLQLPCIIRKFVKK